MAYILLVEDEPNVALTIKNELSTDKHRVEVARDGEAALVSMKVTNFDLVLLDIGLPKKDGYTVCKELRCAGDRTPIIMLTASETEKEKVKGLDAGADDYIVKPWNTLELLARVRAILRRVRSEEPEVYYFGNVTMDVTKGEVIVDKTVTHLTRIEFRLLCILVRRIGRLQRREALYEEIGANSPDAVDNHVMNLRRKIELQPIQCSFIVTVPGVGYRFDGPLKNPDGNLTGF